MKIEGKISEAVAIGLAMEEEESKLARAAARRNLERISAIKRGEEPPPSLARGDVRERIASMIGMSGYSYYRARRVVLKAREDPIKFGDLVELMDNTGNVNTWYAVMVARENGTKVRHVVLKKMRWRKPNREMQKAVDALGGICTVLREIPIHELDAQKLASWGLALKSAAGTILNIVKEIKRYGNERSESNNA